MPSRSGSPYILIATSLCAGLSMVARASADDAPPPPPPGAPTTIVTERMVVVGEDGGPVERGPAVISGRRIVVIDHDGEADGRDMTGPDDRRREVFILRDGPDAGGRPGGRMTPGMGMDGPRMPGRGMHGPGGHRGPDRMMRMARELGFTPEQRTKLRGLMDAARPRMDELRSQIRAQRTKLREADPDAKGYDALVASTSKRIGELTAQREQQRAQLQRQVWQLLTPEQRTKAGSMKAEAKKRREAQADRMERRARELRGTP